jgi:hypothetical protein
VFLLVINACTMYAYKKPSSIKSCIKKYPFLLNFPRHSNQAAEGSSVRKAMIGIAYQRRTTEPSVSHSKQLYIKKKTKHPAAARTRPVGAVPRHRWPTIAYDLRIRPRWPDKEHLNNYSQLSITVMWCIGENCVL